MARLFRKGKKKPALSEDFERSIEQLEHIMESNPSLAALRALLEQYAV
jgi:aminoglycoside/choline kinase family phosphotransferase